MGIFPDYIAPTENFRIGEEGSVTFYYNPYDIACYAFGPVEVVFTAEEVAGMR
ncbi:MAG: RsiV family protein [Alistipes sp.]|nr:RsiV family protein [Alistipes sp.]